MNTRDFLDQILFYCDIEAIRGRRRAENAVLFEARETEPLQNLARTFRAGVHPKHAPKPCHA